MREGGKGEGKEKVNECTQIHKEGSPPPSAGQPKLAIYDNPKSKPTASPPKDNIYVNRAITFRMSGL